MRIVVDINHPAHVHYFKNFIWEMQKKAGSHIFGIFTYLSSNNQLYVYQNEIDAQEKVNELIKNSKLKSDGKLKGDSILEENIYDTNFMVK